jgi:hypothetical protein
MIRVLFTNTEVQFESKSTGKHFAIRYSEQPEVFGHPRHLVVDFERASPLLNAALKVVHGKSLLAPKVEIRIDRIFAGGLADVDYRIIKDFFIHSGAREVNIQK